MGRRQLPGDHPVVDPAPDREAHDRRRGRRRARASSWGEALLGVPWVTLVLVGLVLVAAVDLLRPAAYATVSTVTASSEAAARQAVADLNRPDVVDRVEERIELDEDWRGHVHLRVDRPPTGSEVVVRAQARDPRLAALAADTAAALAVTGAPDDLTLGSAAAVPVHPVGGGPRGWMVAGGPLLVVAGFAERARSRREAREAGDGT